MYFYFYLFLYLYIYIFIYLYIYISNRAAHPCVCVCVAVCVSVWLCVCDVSRPALWKAPPSPRHSPWLKAAGMVTLTSAGVLFLARHAPVRWWRAPGSQSARRCHAVTRLATRCGGHVAATTCVSHFVCLVTWPLMGQSGMPWMDWRHHNHADLAGELATEQKKWMWRVPPILLKFIIES